MSLLAYLRAFIHGGLSGPAEWLGWMGVVLLGIAAAFAIAAGLSALADYLERRKPAPPVPMHRSLDELHDITDAERTSRAQFTSTILALALLGAPVIYLAR